MQGRIWIGEPRRTSKPSVSVVGRRGLGWEGRLVARVKISSLKWYNVLDRRNREKQPRIREAGCAAIASNRI